VMVTKRSSVTMRRKAIGKDMNNLYFYSTVHVFERRLDVYWLSPEGRILT